MVFEAFLTFFVLCLFLLVISLLFFLFTRSFIEIRIEDFFKFELIFMMIVAISFMLTVSFGGDAVIPYLANIFSSGGK